MKGESEPVRGVDRDLTRLIERMKSRRPADRPSAAECALELRAVRDRPRRRARQVAVVVALALVAAGVIKYTIDLRRERSREVEARKHADEARDQAESLIAFMLDDLYTGLERVGRLDLLDSVALKSLAYYQGASAAQLRRGGEKPGKALLKIADILSYRGDWKGAEAGSRRAVEAFRERLSETPGDPDLVYMLAAGQRELSDFLWADGRFAQSLQVIDEALATLARGSAAPETETQRVRRLNLAIKLETDRIDTAWRSGALDAARQFYAPALARAQALHHDQPTDPAWRDAMTNVLVQGCHVFRETGEYDQMIAACRDAVGLIEESARERPRDMQTRSDLGVQLGRLGSGYLVRNEIGAAHDAVTRGLELTREVARYDPANTDWQNDLGMNEVRMGEVLEAMGRHDDARAEWESAAARMASLTGDGAALFMLDTRACALILLGRSEEARPLVERLIAKGWNRRALLDLARTGGLVPAMPPGATAAPPGAPRSSG